MNACPALVAGVKELIICTPPALDGSVNESVLAAARLMGIERVYRVGGAQAVAAMAYGTESVPRVDVICGPGNAYVAEAKRQVYGCVGIDGLAGPSEVLIVADGSAREEWVAADMLAQVEHGSGATAVVFAETEEVCERIDEAASALKARALKEIGNLGGNHIMCPGGPRRRDRGEGLGLRFTHHKPFGFAADVKRWARKDGPRQAVEHL